MPYQIRTTTQMDIFPSETALPEWFCAKWQCMNRCTDFSYENYSLPSIHYSLPPYLKLSGFALSYHFLKEEEYVRETFYYILKIYSGILFDGGESLMIELDQCLSYVTMTAQNMSISGELIPATFLAQNFRSLLLRVGTLRNFASSSDSLGTGVIEINYRFHAVLLIWTNALRIFYVLKESSIGLDLLYPPLFGENSIVSQVAAVLSHSLLVVARLTRLPFACRCVKLAWQQLYHTMDEEFFCIFESLLGICSGSLTCTVPENPTTFMLFDLHEAYGTVNAEVFLNVFCALELKEKHYLAPGKRGSDRIRCLNRIVLQITDNNAILSKLCSFFEHLGSEEMKGLEIILQTLFNRLAQELTETSSKSPNFLPESGKQWLEYVTIQGNEKLGNVDYNDEWAAFIRIIFNVIPRSEEAWRSLKSRVFAKFTARKLREMPLTCFVQLISVFISFAISADLSDVSEKVLQLFANVFEDCEKDRVRIILRGVHALIELHRQRKVDESRIVNTLVTFMEKLSELEHTSFYLESYLYVCAKEVTLNKLPKFLNSMNDIDLCRLLEASAKVNTSIESVWEIALSKIDSSLSDQAISFIIDQLKTTYEENPSLAVVRMRSVVKAMLDEKTISTAICFKFLKTFFHEGKQESSFPVEILFPIWLVVLMLDSDSEDLLNVSRSMFLGFRHYLQNRGFTVMSSDFSISTSGDFLKRILEKIAILPSGSAVSGRFFLETWLENLLPVLSVFLPRADLKTVENSTRIASYIFQYCACLIFRPPQECVFNRSIFVKISKLYLQNTLLNRSFKESFLEECLPNFLTGLLRLPVSCTPYLQRLLSDIIIKFGSVFSLKKILLKQLNAHPDIILILRRLNSKELILQKFLSSLSV